MFNTVAFSMAIVRLSCSLDVIMLSALYIGFLQTGSAAAAASIASISAGMPTPAQAASSKMWERVDLPFDDTLYDIAFDR